MHLNRTDTTLLARVAADPGTTDIHNLKQRIPSFFRGLYEASRVLKLEEAGYLAVRTTHEPLSAELLSWFKNYPAFMRPQATYVRVSHYMLTPAGAAALRAG